MVDKGHNFFENKMSELDEKKHDNTYSGNTSSVYISNRRQEKGGSCLLLIDPQTDFVTGSLAVTGAVEDCTRIANFIKNNLTNLQEIYVTLDTHMNYHIAHPMFWRVGETDIQPPPFTSITLEDIEKKKYRPVDASMKSWVKTYAETLQNTQRLPGLESFVLTIWPPHCLIGTPGHCVEQHILEALQLWEKANNTAVHYIIKGNNSKTEHYSAFRAEVLVPEDKATNFNEKLLKDLERHSSIYVAGEAKSHCVNFTVRDLVQGLGQEASLKKIVLLEGGMSSVTGCDAQGDKFWNDMTSKTGGNKLRSVDIIRHNVTALGVGLSSRNLLAEKKLNV